MNFTKTKGTCLDIQTAQEKDVLKFLQSNPDNIVIGNDGDLGCYQRSQIQKDHLNKKYINSYHHDGEIFYRVYPDLFVTLKGYNLMMDFKYCFYNLKFVRVDSNTVKSYKIYSVNAYTLKDYLETGVEINYAPLKIFDDSNDYDL